MSKKDIKYTAIDTEAAAIAKAQLQAKSDLEYKKRNELIDRIQKCSLFELENYIKHYLNGTPHRENDDRFMPWDIYGNLTVVFRDMELMKIRADQTYSVNFSQYGEMYYNLPEPHTANSAASAFRAVYEVISTLWFRWHNLARKSIETIDEVKTLKEQVKELMDKVKELTQTQKNA